MTETQSTRTGRKTRCHPGKHPGMLYIVTRDHGGRDDVMRKSPISGICEKMKTRRLGQGGLWPSSFLEKYRCAAGTECAALSSSLDAQHFRQASTRSTFVRFQCAALSSSFDAQHFRQVLMHLRDPLQHYHSCVRRVSACPARNLCLANAACRLKTCNDDHILCSSFFLANYGFSSAQKASCVYGSHLRKISVLYIKHTCSFLGRGGVQKKWRVFVFSQISVITDGP